jgi:thiol:disulfide interchange protein DsbC
MLGRLLIVCLCLASFAAWAEDQVPEAVAEKIVASLSLARPDLTFDDVRFSEIPGLYRVRVNQSQFLYASEDGQYMIAGEMYEVKPGYFSSVLDEELNVLRKEKLAKVPEEKMIIFPASGERRAYLYVFTDIDCGYCRKLHNETVPDLNAAGVEVRYLAFPRAGIDSASYRKIATAWCADNPREVLTRYKKGEKIADDVCEGNPVAEEFQLARQLGITGTPGLVLADGTLLPGFQPAPELLKILGLN